jgi:hypothetical protein
MTKKLAIRETLLAISWSIAEDLDVFIKRLTDLNKDGKYQKTTITLDTEKEWGYYDEDCSCVSNLTVIGEREETDKEYEKRIASIEKRKERKAASNEKRKATLARKAEKLKQERLELYNKLKKEFES